MNPKFHYHADSKVMIAAHRGSCGGNIVPNTIDAFDAALYQGADILEADVARSLDGEFYFFHTGFEKLLLGIDKPFEQMTSTQLEALSLHNEFGKETHYRPDRFDAVMEHLKNRCIINLDRCWDDWETLIPIVRAHKMQDQILLKSPCRPELLRKVEDVAPEFAYMPIINEDMQGFWNMGGKHLRNLVGAELVFSSENAPVIANHTVEQLHQMGMLAWGNGIHFSDAKILSAGHDDVVSITGHPENGWGWLLDAGFDIIQTDWVSALYHYINSSK